MNTEKLLYQAWEDLLACKAGLIAGLKSLYILFIFYFYFYIIINKASRQAKPAQAHKPYYIKPDGTFLMS